MLNLIAQGIITPCPACENKKIKKCLQHGQDGAIVKKILEKGKNGYVKESFYNIYADAADEGWTQHLYLRSACARIQMRGLLFFVRITKAILVGIENYFGPYREQKFPGTVFCYEKYYN